jgi:hypothetical protein
VKFLTSQPHRPPRPVTGIALVSFFFTHVAVKFLLVYSTFRISLLQVNYNDGTVEGRDDATWQENLSDYNSDFSAPSGNLFIILYHCPCIVMTS